MPKIVPWTKLLSIGLIIVLTAVIAALETKEHALNNVPSLKLHVTLHRKSMHLHGHSTFTIEANPVVSDTGDRVLYNGRVTFVENETETNYLFVNGTGYVTSKGNEKPTGSESIHCLPAKKFPFLAILPALNNVKRIASASIGGKAIECERGHLFKTSFTGDHLVLCAQGRAGFRVYSSDWKVRVEYVTTRTVISLPREVKEPNCDVIARARSVTPLALALLTGRDMPMTSSRHLQTAEHINMKAATCSCRSKPRPCIFFHGIGNRHEMIALQSTPKSTNHRMGYMNDHAPCCSTVKYAVLDTIASSWTTKSLQQKFCDRAMSVSPSSDPERGIIDDTIIVTHSMAALVMSMALYTGKCRFGENSTWVAISAPMMGSMVADTSESLCDNKLTRLALEFIGLCPLPPSRGSMYYEHGVFASDKLNAMYAAAQEAYRGNVSAAMCSNHYNGLFSHYQTALIAAGVIVPHKSRENDGLVEFQSCVKGLDDKPFGDSYLDTFYMPKLNHADTAFLNGDGFFDDAKKPVKWFECLL